MFEKGFRWVKRLSDAVSDECFERNKNADGICYGVFGGDRSTGFLSETCIGCKHHTMPTVIYQRKLDVTMSEKQEKKRRYNQKLEYIAHFEKWLKEEPSMLNFIAWLKWKNARPHCSAQMDEVLEENATTTNNTQKVSVDGVKIPVISMEDVPKLAKEMEK